MLQVRRKEHSRVNRGRWCIHYPLLFSVERERENVTREQNPC